MPIPDQLLDKLLADCKSPDDVMAEQDLLRQLTKSLLNAPLKLRLSAILATPNMIL